jgi:hypothetical protein
MPDSRNSSSMDKVWVVLLAVLVAAFLAHLYFLSSFSKGSVATLPIEAIQGQRLQQLEAEISRLQTQNTRTPQTKSAQDSEDAYQRGLRQHEALLNETRSELKLAQDQLREATEAVKTARETTQRMQDAETAFLAIFGIIGAFIAGQGYLQIRGWNDRAQDALKEVEDVKPDLQSIRDARESMETELPTFLDRASDILRVQDATGFIEREHISLMDQIDHFTYLSAPVRFRKIRSDEEAAKYLEKYLEALRVAARGHLARSAIWEAMSRLNEFFILAERFPKAVTDKNKALSYYYRALAGHQQVSTLLAEQSWIRSSKTAQILEIRDRAFQDVKQARDCYPQYNYADFAEALLCSLQFGADPTTTGVLPEEAILLGQQKAAGIYRTILTAAIGRKRWASLQNLACCLKRIAAITGQQSDYSAFKAELTSYPSDKELRQQTATEAQGRLELTFLWQGMMADSELFASTGRLELLGYRAFWTDLLTQKIVLRRWKDDLVEMQLRNPKMKTWEVTL